MILPKRRSSERATSVKAAIEAGGLVTLAPDSPFDSSPGDWPNQQVRCRPCGLGRPVERFWS